MSKRIPQTLHAHPIGVIRTALKTKFDAPHQPSGVREDENVIELFPKQNFEQAVKDLEGFERIWIVSWFHKNAAWKPLVLPPRGGAVKRGVFATRSPHRPNAIGLTAAKLLRVSGREVYVGEVDLVDGTPILDLKPYLPGVDAFPESRSGWVGEMERVLRDGPHFSVEYSAAARKQIDWLKKEWNIDFISRAVQLLEVDPTPHRTRRITKSGKIFKMGCGAWRLYFLVKGTMIKIERVEQGYPDSSLKNRSYTRIPDREAQIAFAKKWGES